jgi:predicted ATPase
MPVEFSRLDVRGYRRLRNVQLPLTAFNVLIGANGVGKTSILEVMALLADSAIGKLDERISQAGGFSDIFAGGISSLFTQDISSNIAIELELETQVASGKRSKYSLYLRPRGTGYTIYSEKLSQYIDTKVIFTKIIESTSANVKYYSGKKIIEPNWNYKSQETALSQVPKMYKEAEDFRYLLGSSAIYNMLDVSPRAPIRLPQSLQPADTPGKNGETLLSCLYALREDAPDRYEAVIDALRAAFPTFEKLELPTVAAGQVTMRWKDRNFTNPVYPHQLSEGTLRFLWLATLLQSPGLPKVTLIDEPEVSLHPEMLQLLTELMREASSRTQLIVATHSDRFVRFLKPEELVVCDLDEEGGTSVKRAGELDLDKWLADYALDELWSMGRLGGRP